MSLSKVTRNGQVVIPVEFRKKYGITPGMKIFFREEAGFITLVPMKPEMIKSFAGILPTKGKAVGTLLQERKKDLELEERKFRKLRKV